MAVHAEKTPAKAHQLAGHGGARKRIAGHAPVQAAVNRPEAMVHQEGLHQELRQVAETSPQAVQLRAFHDIANNGPQDKKTAQLRALSDAHTARQHSPVQRQENKTGLPDTLKTGIETLSGYSMDDVKVHYNSGKPAQLNAHAYTQGTDIHLASGQERHLPHEAWHAVQQKQGRVKPTLQAKGAAINDDRGLEHEADVMGTKAVQMKAVAPDLESRSSVQHGSRPETAQTHAPPRTRLKTSSQGKDGVAQRVVFLTVKRIANNGSLYTGLSTAGPPNLNHNQGTNWWGPKATAVEYTRNLAGVVLGAMWEARATRALNLVDMSTAKSVSEAMEETIRRTQTNAPPGLNAALLGVLGNFDFAYAIPLEVARTAAMCTQYAIDEFNQQGTGTWTNNPHVPQNAVDNIVQFAVQFGVNLAQLPAALGAVIQPFAGQNSGNAVRLDDRNFLANPGNYYVLRKDATALDAGFVNALLQDLNNPAMFHGLHVPRGMKFGGWTDTKHEILIKNAPANLALQPAGNPAAVAPNGPEPDLQVTDKQLAVDDSILAQTWRRMGRNN